MKGAPTPQWGTAERVLDWLRGVVFTHDRRRALRIVQWLMAATVYAGAGLLMRDGIDHYWMRADRLIGWCMFVGAGIVVAYIALRSGWSERFADPALTEWQIVMAVLSVDWAYLICGPVRSLRLFPLLVIFSFGAFALRWRRIAGLTVFAMATLACVTAYVAHFPPQDTRAPDAASLSLDRVNFIMLLILLPALSVIAARLSTLRSRLSDKRHELTAALEEVQRRATTDVLTNLPNRRWMIERLEQEQRRCDEGDGYYAVAMVDLDQFKALNDRLGHAAGDRVLSAFASIARHALPARAMLARWGGEEFLVLMPGMDPAMSHDAIAKVAAAVAATGLDGQRVTFSAGIARSMPFGALEETVARADACMYRAKSEGRDRIVSEDNSDLRMDDVLVRPA